MDVVRAGIAAADAGRLVARALTADAPAGGLYLLAAGKAAPAMARAAVRLLGPEIRGGLVVAPSPADLPRGVDLVVAGHPVPTEASERAGRRALALAGAALPDDTLLVLLSGGASALMVAPADAVALADKQAATNTLLRAGADIAAMNAVRKHLSAIKGGWLAARSRARCRTLAISDVVGDDLSVIASGPTVADRTTFGDAMDVLQRFGGVSRYPAAVVARLVAGQRGEIAETPKPHDPRLARSDAAVIGGRRDAMAGVAREAAARGYHVVTVDEPVVGEARTRAPAHLARVLALAREVARPTCVVSSGETTVHVVGDGKGGRNQEFALAAAGPLAAAGVTAALASIGTDGIDGPTDAAGAMADSTTTTRATAARLDLDRCLGSNDAYSFFDALGDLVRTGPTTTNVGDLQIILLA